MKLQTWFLIAFLFVSTLVSAQEDVVRVSRSSGVAEIEIPGRGWLQAVSGRALPEGGSVATWVDAALEISGLGAELELGPLTILELVSVDVGANGDGPSLTIRLRAGAVTVRTSDASIVVLTERAELALAPGGSLVYGDDIVTLEDGVLNVRYRRGGDREVVSPATVDLRELDVNPVLQGPLPASRY